MNNLFQKVNILDQIIHADTNKNLVRLNDVFNIGNSIRQSKGLEPLRMQQFIESKETIEFLIAIEEQEPNSCAAHDLEFRTNGQVSNVKQLKLKYLSTRKGRYNNGTWGHSLLALKAAAKLDATFELQILKEFIQNRIIEERNISKHKYQTLYTLYKAKAGSYFKDYHLMNIAKRIKSKLNVSDWNSASSEALSNRVKIENILIALLECSLIKTYSEVIQTIDNVSLDSIQESSTELLTQTY